MAYVTISVIAATFSRARSCISPTTSEVHSTDVLPRSLGRLPGARARVSVSRNVAAHFSPGIMHKFPGRNFSTSAGGKFSWGGARGSLHRPRANNYCLDELLVDRNFTKTCSFRRGRGRMTGQKYEGFHDRRGREFLRSKLSGDWAEALEEAWNDAKVNARYTTGLGLIEWKGIVAGQLGRKERQKVRSCNAETPCTRQGD